MRNYNYVNDMQARLIIKGEWAKMSGLSMETYIHKEGQKKPISSKKQKIRRALYHTL